MTLSNPVPWQNCLSRLHSADEDAVSWLTSYGSWQAYEKKKKKNIKAETTAHIRYPTFVIDTVHYICCEIQTREPFIIPEMTFKGHWNCHPSLDHLHILSLTSEVSYTYFQTKREEMTLKVVQGHWRQHNSIGHIFYFPLVVCSNRMSLSYIISEIFNVE